jgi:ABC-type transport system involved in multi-copper enzyme maturation permease subunit
MLPMARTDLLQRLSPSWLVGPVFGKELRVASRQRRSYFIRFAYVGLLTVFVAAAWFSAGPGGGRGFVAYQTSRMATAGKHIAMTIVWFQFAAAQLLAIVLLSKTVDAEIRKRTLHLLAVTPISGLQIVGGKLAGGLLHIMMLLATSLPLLAVARVLGGVPWDYVISGVCITFAATVFIAALNVVPSAFYPHKRWVVAQTVWILVLCRVVDGPLEWLMHLRPALGKIGKSILLLVNPTDVLLARTSEMLTARASTGLSSWWPLHGLILLGGAAVILLLAARRVRTIAADLPAQRTLGPAARQSMTQAGHAGRRTSGLLRRRVRPPAPIRRVEGSPVLWKELRNLTVFGSRRLFVIYGVPAMIVCLLVAAGIAVAVVIFDSKASQVVGVMTGCTLGIHVGAILGFSMTAAKGIAGEREARTLPVLLTAPLEDKEIMRDKALAAFRQGLLILIPMSLVFLLLLILLAQVTKEIGPLAAAGGAGLYLVCLLGIVPFFIGMGQYCSVRLKTTAAATGCMSLAFLGLMVLGVMGASLARPIRLILSEMWLTAFVLVILAALACAGIGLVLLRAAARRLRGRVF